MLLSVNTYRVHYCRPAESEAVLGNSVERRLIEVLIQIPDFGLIPVRIPFDALAQATFPLEASPVISISSSIPQTVAPLTASPVTLRENTASVKQACTRLILCLI